ncbi:DUF5686 family protein [Cloacibacterium normanense]|uniref:Carboxypeptidase-like regulatory domain-containing protein n=1 Tax=Cloacibacterium normanense TaxID=237258 RepID=A0A1E5UFB5_9FLAO|nr:DUF5686 family protein [Cloacibacterium normanense]AZI69598.1 hypothetical protein EB819_06780 [Cloacibacterium normanense]OEL11477.1 hypothetical protein BHF72_2023 [Cloacibacterium normanense]SDO83110.1 hypothetical protein SAMN04489756_12111 [Cloacibacterium normanense]
MKKTLSALFLLIFTLYFSQNQLQVINAKNQKAVYNAAVYCDDDLLGKTDANGKLTFKTKCKKVEIFANNFEDKEVSVQKEMKVSLAPSKEKTGNIDKVILTDKSDAKALKILDEFNKNYKKNSPQALDSYQFKSYSKISIDVDKDSLSTYKEFLAKREDSLARIEKRTFKQKDKEKKDSLLGEDFVNATKESQFFLWEKASEHKFSKKYGEKTNILDNRMSGFPNPIYEALALNISYLNRIPRQLSPENRNIYRYYLSDTIEIDNRKTYVIKFKEITNKLKQNPRKYNGKIHIDAENYALKKLETSSKKRNEGSGTIIWKPINNKWFLVSENLKVKMGDSRFETAKKDSVKKDEKQKFKTKKFGNFLYVKNQYFDFETNITQQKSDFSGYSLEVKNADGSLLSQYRTDSLTTRESATYNKIDTLVKKANIEKKVSLFTNLMKGNFRYKMLDFDLTKLIKFDQYEGLRLGTGVKLNEKFSKTFSPDAYFGYGFRDHTWKYGAGLDFKISQKRTSIFRIQYFDDVFAAGRFSNNLWDNFTKMQDLDLDLHNANFYKNQQISTSFLYDVTNSLTFKLALNKEKQKALFDYQYKNFANNFENFSTTLSLKYSPNDKNIMTPGGKYTYEKKFPQFFVNFEKGLESFGGKLDYQRLDALAIHQFRSKIGVTNLKFFGGISSGTAPIWKNFELAGQTDISTEKLRGRINTPSNLGFVTMPSGTFYADKFVAFQVSQLLPFKFRTLGKNLSSLQIEYQSAVGNFKNPENHQFNFQVLNHNYQEVGLVWNRFLGTGLGLGFSYRLGYYQTSEFKDNFGLQLRFVSF